MDLLDCSEQLTKAQSQVTKLQASLDNVMKEKVRREKGETLWTFSKAIRLNLCLACDI